MFFEGLFTFLFHLIATRFSPYIPVPGLVVFNFPKTPYDRSYTLVSKPSLYSRAIQYVSGMPFPLQISVI